MNNRLRISDLKKPLPKNLSQQAKKRALLDRIKKVSSTKSLTRSKKPGRSFGMKGQAGTNLALLKIKRIAQMQSRFPLNNEVATKIYRIYERLLREQIDMEQRPGSEHQLLVNATNKLLKAERNKREVILSEKEERVINKYSF